MGQRNERATLVFCCMPAQWLAVRVALTNWSEHPHRGDRDHDRLPMASNNSSSRLDLSMMFMVSELRESPHSGPSGKFQCRCPVSLNGCQLAASTLRKPPAPPPFGCHYLLHVTPSRQLLLRRQKAQYLRTKLLGFVSSLHAADLLRSSHQLSTPHRQASAQGGLPTA